MIRGYKIATIKKIKDIIHNKFRTGELQFASTEFAPTEFAPTENLPIKINFSEEKQLASAKKIIQLDYKIWQRNYYENIIWDELSYNRISKYIEKNPSKWTADKFY